MPDHDPVVATRKRSRQGEYLSGVPNTDIPLSVWQGMTSEQHADVRGSGLYDVRPVAEARAEAKAAAEAPATEATEATKTEAAPRASVPAAKAKE